MAAWSLSGITFKTTRSWCDLQELEFRRGTPTNSESVCWTQTEAVKQPHAKDTAACASQVMGQWGNRWTKHCSTLNGKIIGFIDGGVERSGTYNCDGELYAIYLLQQYQGLKIGQKLFQALLSECIKNGMQSLLVWVVTNNPAKKFYEKYNPEKIDTKFLERVQVEETAYCWRNINNIIM